MSERLKFDPDAPGVVESRCEFCGKTFWLDTGLVACVHEMPTCVEFQSMDALTFAVENRKIKEARNTRNQN